MNEAAMAATVVQAWQDAVNVGDIERLLALSEENIEIVGPRGTTRGHAVLRDWAGRAGAQFHPRRTFRRGETVVVEQHGQWRSETGAIMGEQNVASVFNVVDGRVTRVARYDDSAEALRQAGLTEADEQHDA